MIQNMKSADVVTKATPWSFEGIHDEKMSVRYVGIRIKNDWLTLFSERNNLLVKFVIDRSTARVEFYLANKPPFIKITSSSFSTNDKWEVLLGEFKRRLKKDKEDVLQKRPSVGNVYERLKPYLQ
jgi:hypothetical protein